VATLEDSECRLDLARALIRLGSHMYASGHDRAAREVLERGLDIASDCGAATLAATARQAMRAVGARPRSHPATVTLTAAERRVAELVISGMSNQDVADTLTLSKRTVDTHLGRIYRKLGITGRNRLREAISGTDR
jgi:DNA-binding CsgD family transcriptional regulator